jgi:ADP-ribose pyrophosphatase YjhB (NUDIX family)
MKEECAGGIVLGESGTIALVWSKHSQAWLFPKGHVEPNETNEEAARREIEEETGLSDLEYLDELGTIERPGANGRNSKSIHMYLFAAAAGATLSGGNGHEIEKTIWMPLPHVASELGAGENEKWFSADRAWFTTVFERIRQAIQRD